MSPGWVSFGKLDPELCCGEISYLLKTIIDWAPSARYDHSTAKSGRVDSRFPDLIVPIFWFALVLMVIFYRRVMVFPVVGYLTYVLEYM